MSFPWAGCPSHFQIPKLEGAPHNKDWLKCFILHNPPMSTVWSFDLGKGSIGEAVRELSTNQFLHVEALLIPVLFR